MSKRAISRARAKERKRALRTESTSEATPTVSEPQVDYVAAVPEDLLEDEFAQFHSVFQYFLTPKNQGETDSTNQAQFDDSQELDGALQEIHEEKQLSNKQKRKLNRISLAYLKQTVARPDAVEEHDANSANPHLLIYLKTYRNTVPVPIHWSQKRKFLQGKRGFVKPPFKLPSFIEATGIGRMRAAQLQAEADKKAKQKMRERARPKMGRLEIDYQVLHDAFFKYQKKPKMTRVGDLYYEGKEFQVTLINRRPGQLSQELRNALGMKDTTPPPWLLNMQRFGPPPAYRILKIPGLNAPIPPGCSYGYNEGQWGKPPVDQFGNPLYGDPFGVWVDESAQKKLSKAETYRWGELEEIEVTEPQPEAIREVNDEEEEVPEDFGVGPSADFDSGVESVSTLDGIETPDTVHLRKDTGIETPEVSRDLYTVLPSVETSVGGEIFGSTQTYSIPKGVSKSDIVNRQIDTGTRMEIALEPSDLEKLDEATLAEKYEKQRLAQRQASTTEDFSELIAEESRKRKLKEDSRAKKKLKNFKFG